MTKFVSALSSDEALSLNELSKFGPCYRYRQRAHMILLSARGYTLDTLSDIFQLHRNQISETLNRWDEWGLVGLKDLPGKGRPRKLDEQSLASLIGWVESQVPRSAKEMVCYAQEVLSLHVSEDTIKHHLKEAGFSYKRLRKAVKHKREPEAFLQATAEIAELKAKHAAGDIDLQYFDGSGFSLTPTVPYAWQKKG